MRSGMEAMISSRSLLPPTLRVCRQDRGEHEELWPPPWSPHRRGWSTLSAYSLWRSLLLFRSCGDRILPMCPSPTTSSSPGCRHGSRHCCPQLLCLELDGQPPWIPQLEGHVNQPSSHAAAARRFHGSPYTKSGVQSSTYILGLYC